MSSDFDRLLEDDDVSEASSTALPPVDGGRGAWMCLLGCWLVESMAWGLPLAYGVFESHYSSNELFRGSHWIPTIGTLATGVSYMGMPFINPVAIRLPQHRRKICIAGFALMLAGLTGASFATEVWHLLLSQGFLYGIGWVVCYAPFLFMLNEWFVEKRGLAYGILFCASGVSGLVIPLVVGTLLQRFGFRTTLRACATSLVVISGPGLFLIKPRSSATMLDKRAVSGRSSFQALRAMATNNHFIAFTVAIFLQGLGFFMPNIFIPSFAEDLGLSSTASSGLLTLISMSQVLGQLAQGWVSDRVNVYIPLSLSALVPGVGALLLWGPAKSMALLAPFAILWGFFSSSYSVLYTRICTFLIQDEGQEESGDDGLAMLLYGFFSFERGISNMLEGPISSWLIGYDRHAIDTRKYGLGMYAPLVFFTTICMLASSLVGIKWLWVKMRSV